MPSRTLTFQDKLLPVQPEFRRAFTGTDEEHVRAMYEMIVRCCGLRDPEIEFTLETAPLHPIADLGSSPATLRLLQLLAAISGARRVLEIGTFIGVSAMSIAQALPADGTVTTVEKFDQFASIARRNFAANGLDGRISLIVGDAFAVLATLDKSAFDMIFLDGNKERYAEYFTALDPHLRSGGLFVTDDVFFHGDALNSVPTGEKGMGTRQFLELMAGRDDYLRLVLPMSNGIFVARKR